MPSIPRLLLAFVVGTAGWAVGTSLLNGDGDLWTVRRWVSAALFSLILLAVNAWWRREADHEPSA